MFDIGFSEIAVIGVVALVVLGPERLPKVMRTAGQWFGKLQRYVNDVKSDISREMELDELRKIQAEVKSAAAELQQSVQSATASIEATARDVKQELNATAASATEALHSPAPDSVPASDATDVLARGEPVHAYEAPLDSPALPREPDLLTALTPQGVAEPPRQAALPGFDKI